MVIINIEIEENQEKKSKKFLNWDSAISYLKENKPDNSLTDRRKEALHD